MRTSRLAAAGGRVSPRGSKHFLGRGTCRRSTDWMRGGGSGSCVSSGLDGRPDRRTSPGRHDACTGRIPSSRRGSSFADDVAPCRLRGTSVVNQRRPAACLVDPSRDDQSSPTLGRRTPRMLLPERRSLAQRTFTDGFGPRETGDVCNCEGHRLATGLNRYGVEASLPTLGSPAGAAAALLCDQRLARMITPQRACPRPAHQG